jgi:hypothetical protein
VVPEERLRCAALLCSVLLLRCLLACVLATTTRAPFPRAPFSPLPRAVHVDAGTRPLTFFSLAFSLPHSLFLPLPLPLPLSPIPAAACLSCTTLGTDPRHSSLQSRSLPWYHELGAHTLDLNLDLNLNCILDQRPTPNEQLPRQALQEQQYCITWRCVARPRRNFQLGTMEPHSFV